MTLAEIIRAQLATGRPLRVTRALLEALDASETDAAVMASLRVTAREHATMMRDDLLYGTRTALCEALALPASTPGPAIVAAVVAIRETAKHDREERDEARRELSHRPTMIAHTAACRERDEERARANEWLAQKHDAERERDEALRRLGPTDSHPGLAWQALNRERDEARAQLAALRAHACIHGYAALVVGDVAIAATADAYRERIEAPLRAEVERLTAERDDATARTIHSCHAGCSRPMCVLRRERDTLRAEVERLTVTLASERAARKGVIDDALVATCRAREAERDTLAAALAEVREAALRACDTLTEPESHYGYPMSDDPRMFVPDPECSTEAERDAHERATRARSAGIGDPLPSSWTLHETRDAAEAHLRASGSAVGLVVARDDGRFVVHAHAEGWGLGTSLIMDTRASEIVAPLRAALAALPADLAAEHDRRVRAEALEAAAQEVDAIHRDEVAEYGVGRAASYAEIGTWLRTRAAASE